MSTKKISVVIPCYRADDTLEAVISEIRTAFSAQADYTYQIVLVNDNSPDATWQVIQKLCAEDSAITGIDLSKNFGQAVATLVGLKYSSGGIAVTMDDDGQHPAEGIFALAKEIESGQDIVCASFPHKKHSLFKRLVSRMNALSRSFAGTVPPDVRMSSFCAYSQICISALKEYESPYPMIMGYLMQVTNRIKSIELPHRERLAGTTTYSLKKLFSLWALSFFNFTIRPLRIASVVGGAVSAAGFLYTLYLIIRKLCGANVSGGYTSIMAVILIIGGLQMLMLGICGEYIGKTFISICGKPQFKIRQAINIPEGGIGND